MRMILGSISLLSVLVTTTMSMAQPPGGPPPGRRGQGGGMDMTAMIGQMLTMDANQDGMLTSDEVSDKRMLSILKRADSNNDGAVTQDELTTFARKANTQQPGGRGGPGGRNGRDMGPPPKPGQILPAHLQDELNLTESQRRKLDALQKEVDAKLAKILTDEQRQQLEELGNRGPGGPGGPAGGGPGGFGPPPGGGPPPQDF